jgi:hypothetical protein
VRKWATVKLWDEKTLGEQRTNAVPPYARQGRRNQTTWGGYPHAGTLPFASGANKRKSTYMQDKIQKSTTYLKQ